MENHVYLQINSRCNQKCVFCNRPPKDNPDEYTKDIAIEKIKQRVKQLVERGNKRIILTGGEPTLRNDLDEIIRFCKHSGVEIVEIQTNGILFFNEELVKKLKRAGLDFAYIAFHAHNKKLYDKMARTNSFFDEKIKGIENCIKNGLKVSIIHVINELNYKYIKEFVKFMNNKFPEISYYNLSFVVPEGHAWLNKWCVPKYSDVKSYLRRAMQYCKENKIKFDVSEIVPLCMIEGFEEHAASTKFLFDNIVIIDDYYSDTSHKKLDFRNLDKIYAQKAPQCSKCSLNEICAGFNPNYAKIHGMGEFKPSNKPKEEIIKKFEKRGQPKKAYKKLINLKKEGQRFYLSLSEECNENCLFCVLKGENVGKIGNLTTEEAKEILDDLKGTNLSLQITGGEPTIREDLPEIINYAVKKGIKNMTIITNAVELADMIKTRKIIESASPTEINFSVSLHSHKKDVSEFLTGSKNTFEKTIKGIENLIKLNKKVNLYHIITSKNYMDLEDFITFIHDKFPEIKHITLSYVFPQGNALKNKWIFPKLSDIEPHMYNAFKIMKKYGIEFDFSSCGTFPLCYVRGFEKLVIEGLVKDEKEVIGLKSANVFHEFEMTNPEWEEQYKTKNPSCSFCIFNKFCRGVWKEYSKLYGLSELRPIFINDEKNHIIKITSDFSVKDVIEKTDPNTINLIDLEIKKLDKRLGEKINKLIEELEKNKIYFSFIKPIPPCLGVKNKFIPKSCKDCLKLFKKNGDELEICKRINSKNFKISTETRKDEIVQNIKPIKPKNEFYEVCKNCVYRIRGQCNGICNV